LHLLAVLGLDHLLGRDDDPAKARALPHRLDAVLEVGLDLVLMAGIGVDDVPAEHADPLLAQEDLRDDVLPHVVVDVEEGADDDAAAEHYDRALDHLVLAGPLDLLELRPCLRDEVPVALFRLPGLDADGRMPFGARVRHELARLPVRRVAAAPTAVLAE